MKVLIIDFDGLLHIDLRNKLKDYADRVTISAASSGHRAIELIRSSTPDLSIIEYKSSYALEFGSIFRKLMRANLDFIIIAKSDKYRVYEDIFEFNPRAFFCAPIDMVSLKYLIDRMILDRKSMINNPTTSGKDYFVFKWNSQLRKEKFSEIDFIHAEGNYVTLHFNDREYILRYSLKMILTELLPRNFVQIHRNYIVNINGVHSIDIGENLANLGNTQLPIGRKYKKAIKSAFSKSDNSPL